VKQLGVDRIVQMTFGSGPAACHLLLEFYAQASRSSSAGSTRQRQQMTVARWRLMGQNMRFHACCWCESHAFACPLRSPCFLPCLQGNVILADDKFEVLTLLRSHRWGWLIACGQADRLAGRGGG
jgi:hypothetical protein